MLNLRTTNDIVRMILLRMPATRNSDNILYCEVCNQINPMVKNMNFEYVMRNRKELGIPGFETVRRARQKLQAEHQELAANNEVSMIRSDLEREYRNYAVGV